MENNPGCCPRGRCEIFRCVHNPANWWMNGDNECIYVKFCPFCGRELSPSSSRELAGGRIVIDVDGTVCDDSDTSLQYADRPAYPFAADAIRRMKVANFIIVFATARYMNRFEGDQKKAAEYGGQELRWWLKANDIPFDEIHFGKPSTNTYYVDDKAFRVRSSEGSGDWNSLLAVLLPVGPV